MYMIALYIVVGALYEYVNRHATLKLKGVEWLRLKWWNKIALTLMLPGAVYFMVTVTRGAPYDPGRYNLCKRWYRLVIICLWPLVIAIKLCAMIMVAMWLGMEEYPSERLGWYDRPREVAGRRARLGLVIRERERLRLEADEAQAKFAKRLAVLTEEQVRLESELELAAGPAYRSLPTSGMSEKPET